MRYHIISSGTCALLDISSMGYSKDSAVTRFGPGRRDQYIIHYVLSGKGYFNGHPVCAGQGFLITPSMLEEYFPDKEDPWEFLWVISRDKKMNELFAAYHADPHTHIFSYDFIYAVRELSNRIIAKTSSRISPYEQLELFLSVFKHHTDISQGAAEKRSSEIYVTAAVNYIEANKHAPLTVAELTDFLGISQPYLFAIFKSAFSQSPKQYILNCKVLHAQKLLTETDLTITQIAASVGYEDALSFSKLFSLKVELSPQKYRKQKAAAE